MSEDQFTKLFNHMNRRFDEQASDMDLKFAEVHERLDQVCNLIDGTAKHQQDAEVERAALAASDNRQREWIKQLAKSTNTELIPEA